jgi:predicted SAM-dependent methyltransferase
VSAAIVQFPVKNEQPDPEPAGVRLNLGCNQNALQGFVNVDIEKYPGVDVVTDLEKVWPWDDNSVDEIYTADLPEHLRGWYETYDFGGVNSLQDLIAALQKPQRHYGVFHFMNEAWRVLKPGGLLKARIPTTESKAWAQDPTHVSFWNENTMLYFTHPSYRAIYPRDIKAHFEPVEVKTLMQNHYGEAWVVCVLRKVA